ncbi:MAG TPA: hypothetical protein GXX36_03970 [Clostridiaceae bacterium]|nr:hypothetical protein [Clostridiaceae bacterium]
MNLFIEALNHPIDAFRNKNKTGAWVLVASTILINTVFAPLLTWFACAWYSAPDIFSMMLTTLWGSASYLAICTALWLFCKLFGSKTPLKAYLQTWSLTFFPNLLCSIAVVFSEVYFTVFWNNSIWGILLSIVFVGLLIWKTILYIVFLKEVAGLKGGRMFGAFIVIGIIIVVLALLNGYVGLKTPIL